MQQEFRCKNNSREALIIASLLDFDAEAEKFTNTQFNLGRNSKNFLCKQIKKCDGSKTFNVPMFFHIDRLRARGACRLTERERDERKAKQFADAAATLRT